MFWWEKFLWNSSFEFWRDMSEKWDDGGFKFHSAICICLAILLWRKCVRSCLCWNFFLFLFFVGCYIWFWYQNCKSKGLDMFIMDNQRHNYIPWFWQKLNRKLVILHTCLWHICTCGRPGTFWNTLQLHSLLFGCAELFVRLSLCQVYEYYFFHCFYAV